MAILSIIAGLALIALVLREGFEVILLPRRVSRKHRLTRYFFIGSWRSWRALAGRTGPGKRPQAWLSAYGPCSAVLLFALWAVCLMAAFAAIHWGLGTPMGPAPGLKPRLGEYVYFSGVTFFTLGFGDLAPTEPIGRALAVAEAGLGFGFLAGVIGYLPVFYQAFSARELSISLLDARAGSPPTAGSLLLRVAGSKDGMAALDRFLQEWERWSALVLESHLSFPQLSYYRSQHDNQSWLSALTMVLDASALVIAAGQGVDPYQARLTFAMARHAAVDLAQIYRATPFDPESDRLPADRLGGLLDELRLAGLDLRPDDVAAPKLAKLRAMYEPFVQALSAYLLLPLPPFRAEGGAVDNWQTSAWMDRTRGLGELALPGDDHAD